MAAYMTGFIEVIEPEGYEHYRLNAPATVFQYGGRYITKPGTSKVVEGDWPLGRFVILEFPTMAQLETWWNSPEYAPLKEIRQRAARCRIMMTEGAD